MANLMLPNLDFTIYVVYVTLLHLHTGFTQKELLLLHSLAGKPCPL